MAISDKLQKILNSKAAIKEAINNKGGNVGDVLADYAPAINALSSGRVIDKALEDANYDVEDKLLAAINLSASVTNGITNYRDIAAGDKDKVIFLPVLPPTIQAFAGMHNLLYLPNIDYSTSTDINLLQKLCSNCYSLREANIDCSGKKSLWLMFEQCYSLAKITLINTQDLDSISGFCSNCLLLNEIEINIPNVITAVKAFYNSGISKCVLLNTKKVKDFPQTFYNCVNLKEIRTIDATNCNSFFQTFQTCSKLETIIFVSSTINANIDFSSCPNLTRESVLSILKGLNQVTSTKTLKLHTTTKALITTAQDNVVAGTADELDTAIAEQINGSASVTSVADRGWTIA